MGHVLVSMYSWWAARATGGRYLWIIDDICYDLQKCTRGSGPLRENVDRWLEDMDWLGLAPDEVFWSSRNAEAHADANERSGLNIPLTALSADHSFVGTIIREPYLVGTMLPTIIYDPYFVLIRVVDDHVHGVTDFYRGRDLVTEMQLYDFIARRCHLNPPNQGYLPTVRRQAVPGKESSSDVRSIPIRSLKDAGYTPGEIKRTIRACVRDSAAAGLMDVMIPDGILEPNTHGVLHYNWAEEAWGNVVVTDENALPSTASIIRNYISSAIQRTEAFITSDIGGLRDELS